MSSVPSVLLSWIARNNDPYERDEKTGAPETEPIPGPTLTVLFDPESELKGRVKDVVLLYRQGNGSQEQPERKALDATVAQIRTRQPDLRLHVEAWTGDDPTDHRGIFKFLQGKVPEVRRRFPDRELIIHCSPGTPAMHTIWVLMAETGFIERPFRIVQSYRKRERRGRPVIVPVELGIETFYKVYKTARPSQVTSDEQRVIWDPAKFRTERMRALFREARRFAQLGVPILILGERGTGKTTLAGWIRGVSPYRVEERDASWPAVACGQYTPETMRSELFGHIRGAFTGAIRASDGLLAAADRDSLFLDEVGDVSRDLQRLLIKAVEEKQYTRLGETRPRKSDFRLLTATNLDPEELRRRLDADFLDRISQLTLQLPALREIREELGWLWEDTFAQAAARAGVPSRQKVLGAEHHRHVVTQLQRHPLPGNLRDLFRVAYRILAVRADPQEPLSQEEAVPYGLAALDESGRPEASGSLARSVALAFARATTLDVLLEGAAPLPTGAILQELRAYLAEELRRLSARRRTPIEALCDVSERTIRTWAGEGSSAGKTSGARKMSSEHGGPAIRGQRGHAGPPAGKNR